MGAAVGASPSAMVPFSGGGGCGGGEHFDYAPCGWPSEMATERLSEEYIRLQGCVCCDESPTHIDRARTDHLTV